MTAAKARIACAAPMPKSEGKSVMKSGAKVIPFRPKQSSGTGFGQMSRAAHRRGDPLACYAGFADRWQAFLRAHFTSAFDVAVFFSVTPKAAEKWWDGIGGPHGSKLAYALEEIKGAAAHLLKDVA